MPNWAYNTLTIKGDKDTLAKIKSNLSGKETPLTFDNVIRMPETLNVTSGGINGKNITFYILTLSTSHKEIEQLPSSMLYLVHLNKDYEAATTDEDLVKLLQKYMQEYTSLVVKDKAEHEDEWGFTEGISLVEGYKLFNNIARYGFPSWYEWRTAMWGTKWDACDVKRKDYDDKLVYRFDTAWGGPWNVANAISCQYKDVEVNMTTSYEDPDGEDDITYKNGEIIKAVKHPHYWAVEDHPRAFSDWEQAFEVAKNEVTDEEDAYDLITDGIDHSEWAEIALDARKWQSSANFFPYLVEVA